MRDFGTAAKPLRASSLPNLVLCLWRAVAGEMRLTENEPGPSADTGSAAHLAVAFWHENKLDRAGALAAMRAASAAFQLADLDEAARIFGRYTDDPRNQNAEVIATETKVRVEIDPVYIEGPPIVIQGTLDQIRRVDGRLMVYDLKTGNRDALYFQNCYALQLAAYTLAARQLYPRESVTAGGYIRTKGYFTRGCVLPAPHGVFIPALIDDPDAALNAVRWAVCAIRSGYVVASPGDHCSHCYFGHSNMCIPKLRNLNTLEH